MLDLGSPQQIGSVTVRTVGATDFEVRAADEQGAALDDYTPVERRPVRDADGRAVVVPRQGRCRPATSWSGSPRCRPTNGRLPRPDRRGHRPRLSPQCSGALEPGGADADLPWAGARPGQVRRRRCGDRRGAARRRTPRVTRTRSASSSAGTATGCGPSPLRTLGDREEAADALQDALAVGLPGRSRRGLPRRRRRHHLAAPDRRQRLPRPGPPARGPPRRPAAGARRRRPAATPSASRLDRPRRRGGAARPCPSSSAARWCSSTCTAGRSRTRPRSSTARAAR